MAANKKVSAKDLPYSLTKDTDVIKAMKAMQRGGFWATLGGGYVGCFCPATGPADIRTVCSFDCHRPARAQLPAVCAEVAAWWRGAAGGDVAHGALGSGKQAEKAYGWNELADKYGFIVAYPDGLNRAWAVSDRCCGPPAREKVDDVAFIKSMINDIQKKARIDASRIYVAGMSNGGALAYRLACDTDIFAAIGVVSATLLGECPNPHEVSVVHIHGKEDNIFPYGGGLGSLGTNWDGWLSDLAEARIPSIPDLMGMWRRVNTCTPSAVTINGPIRKAVAACADDREVAFIVIDGAGHQWPGSKASEETGKLLGFDSPSIELHATEVLWDFFAKHHAAGQSAKE